MLNKKALEAAGDTVVLLDAMAGATSTAVLILGELDLRRTIERFIAALPDEDGLVKKLRTEATIAGTQRQGRIAWALGKAADALEVARRPAPEVSDSSGHE